MKTTIPDKLYLKIGEVTKIVGLPSHVLRYWESEFPGIKPTRANSKHRLYKKEDVEHILKIKTLLYDQGYTIAGARELLKKMRLSGESIAVDMPREMENIKLELKALQNFLDSKKKA